MDKFKINMVGGGFQHDICSSSGSVPEFIEWDKNGNANVSMHIDYGINIPVNKLRKNYAWFSESFAIHSQLFSSIHNIIPYLEENFELIFTHDKRLIPLSNKIKLALPNAVPWVNEYKIHQKSKLISMIASTKLMCPGHQYRQEIAEKYKGKVDRFGSGYDFIQKKEDALKDYYFSIQMENYTYPNYFTEKITDCFVTGTIPIFWGIPNIGEFFNESGIIFLTDDFKVEDLSIELYYSKMDAIKDNFDRAIKIPTAEDYIYNNYIKKI